VIPNWIDMIFPFPHKRLFQGVTGGTLSVAAGMSTVLNQPWADDLEILHVR